jgi:hypothetical protein
MFVGICIFLGSLCPSCKVTNWKYQSYVIPMAILVGSIVAVSVFLLVLNKF